ncbi:MAG: YybH family protein [Sulfobacillus sp.]
MQKQAITGYEETKNLSPSQQALISFYRAFNTRDMEAMSLNWAQTKDISMDNPVGGIKRGWTEIREVYAHIFNGPAEVSVEFHDYTLHETQEIFFVVGRERGKFRIGSEVIELAIRTSRIYQWIEGRWQQIHHHGSIDDPALLAHYQSAVRGN